MPYATVQDLIDAFGELEMARVTTPEGQDPAAGLDVGRSTTALTVASDQIDSFLRRRYGTPLAVATPAINRACLMLARYELGFGGAVEPSEQVRLARRDTMAWLRDLNTGSANLEGVELASQVVGARTQDRSGPGFAHGVGPGDPFHQPGSGLGFFGGLW